MVGDRENNAATHFQLTPGVASSCLRNKYQDIPSVSLRKAQPASARTAPGEKQERNSFHSEELLSDSPHNPFSILKADISCEGLLGEITLLWTPSFDCLTSSCGETKLFDF